MKDKIVAFFKAFYDNAPKLGKVVFIIAGIALVVGAVYEVAKVLGVVHG